MKIRDVVTHALSYELPEAFAYSQGWYSTRTAMLVEVITEDGVSGWGESFGPPAPARAMVESVYKPLLLGENPLERAVLWERLYNRSRDWGQKGVAVTALSAVDVALWDVAGKALGQPVHTLLGGCFRPRVKAYATGLYHREVPALTSALAAEAEHYVEQGFGAVKLKVGFGVEADARNVAAVRAAIGPEVGLMVDANHAYDASLALALGRRIEKYDVGWFEEPVPPEDIAGYREVKRGLTIPIAGGEAEFTRYGFRELLNRRAVDIVQPDMCVCGGLSEAHHIAAMASAWGVRCMPHVWGSAVGLAAALQFAAALPNTPPGLAAAQPLFELDRTENPFREELAVGGLPLHEGWLTVPTNPGLGIEVNRAVLERYRA